MHIRRSFRSPKGFTLIELLVVIAIIAILAVVVILTLNPAELLRQSRDSNRVSDMATLTSALGVYSTDQSSASSFSLGSSSVVYVSIPDPSATSTTGTNCASLNLPTLPSTYSYHCAASSTYRNVNGTGWIPVNLSLISSGSPLGNLPVDPTNNSSSKLYYTYTTNGTQYEATAAMESAKYSVGGSNDVISNDGGTLASVYEKGSKFGLEPMDYGDSSLMGLWTFDEGTNTVAYDYSGNNNTGTWSGTQAGTNGYYSAGKIGPYAGNFDGSTDIITGSTFVLASSLPLTISYWVNQKVFSANAGIVAFGTSTPFFSSVGGAGAPLCGYYNGTSYYFSSGNVLSNNVWYFITCVYNANKTVTTYQNGVLIATSGAWSTNTPTGNLTFWIGSLLSGLLDDVRIYNRALSATQIAAMYNGGK